MTNNYTKSRLTGVCFLHEIKGKNRFLFYISQRIFHFLNAVLSFLTWILPFIITVLVDTEGDTLRVERITDRDDAKLRVVSSEIVVKNSEVETAKISFFSKFWDVLLHVSFLCVFLHLIWPPSLPTEQRTRGVFDFNNENPKLCDTPRNHSQLTNRLTVLKKEDWTSPTGN